MNTVKNRAIGFMYLIAIVFLAKDTFEGFSINELFWTRQTIFYVMGVYALINIGTGIYSFERGTFRTKFIGPRNPVGVYAELAIETIYLVLCIYNLLQ